MFLRVDLFVFFVVVDQDFEHANHGGEFILAQLSE
jgi:hypothetical protein